MHKDSTKLLLQPTVQLHNKFCLYPTGINRFLMFLNPSSSFQKFAVIFPFGLSWYQQLRQPPL